MGLIKAAVGAAGGVMADQWKEFFYCEALPNDIMMRKGEKRTSGRSSNTKGSDNIISNGSGIAVADGQCMIIVEQGKIVEVCAEPGEFTYDTSTEPSIFSGKLGDALKRRSRLSESVSPSAETLPRISEFTTSTPRSLSTTSSERRIRFRSVLLTQRSVWI